MDLNKMVNNSLAKMEKNGEVQKLIDKHVALAVESIIEEFFGTESAFSFKLKSTATEAFQINFNDLDLASYNHIILQAVKDKLDGKLKNNGVAQIDGQIESLLANTKCEYKLSELLEELSHEIIDIDYEECHEMTLHIDNIDEFYFFVYMDQKKGVSEYACKYKLILDKTGKLHSVRVRYTESGLKGIVNEFDIFDFGVKEMMMGMHGLGETLSKIYTSQARIIIDESDCQLEISKPK
ncbi:hypothetical protein [Listeria innocua]|uniref:hypothetical protein n=1 Tax=Listeria innocua TaxID=1642 RepID=UPI00162817C8|nr:hypothetical protein [Listeria innocua]MBC1385601.1 hypothetical protein [Listeria innocua]